MLFANSLATDDILTCFFVNDSATTEIYTVLTHSFPTRRSSDLRYPFAWPDRPEHKHRIAFCRASIHRPGSEPEDTPFDNCEEPYRTGWESHRRRSEEHTSELQSLMRISYAVFCLTKKHKVNILRTHTYKYNTLNIHRIYE